MPEIYDTVLANGLFFDGSGRVGQQRHLAVANGKVAAISETPFPPGAAKETFDAKGCWISPGFIDFHTHYDAEVEIAPGLGESVRHGVTTVFQGSCSLGAAIGEPEDIADIFCRVEGVPREIMLPMLRERKTWSTLTEYFEHLDTLPLGPNITSFVPHSNIRMATMGFERSVQPGLRPTETELQEMERLLEEGLDAGYVGLSIQTLPWDKLDGDRRRSRPLPSFFANWGEYRRLAKILRRRDRVFQGVPNLVTKVNVLLFMLESAAFFRKPLRTTVISVVDLICDRKLWWLVPGIARFFNRFLGADFRFQALPNLFDVWADGLELVIFEEFGAGSEAMHLAQLSQRSELLADPAYRKRFKRQWGNYFLPRVYHRRFQHTEILACPEGSCVGRSFAEIAADRGQHVVDTFLDLCAEHGDRLRWYSAIGNDRRKPLEYITSHPDILIGFSDAGAHLRNMAFYNYPLRLLKLARDAELRGEPFMSIERAIHRLTGEPADWFRIDAGKLAVGSRADIAVIDPKGLDDSLETAHEAEMEGFGLRRMVRRNPRSVPLVMINGNIAVRQGEPVPALGTKRGFGIVLRAH
jgi:N-acyl-D-aspartate/D-glutamate deacylase